MLPTVETVGYFQSPLPGLVDRLLAPPDFPPPRHFDLGISPIGLGG